MDAGTSAIRGGRASVADALTRTELDTRARTATGRGSSTGWWRVTLCADDVLCLPVTRGARASHSSRAARLPLALARRAAEEARMAKAVAELGERGETVTSRALAEAAHISLNTACTWRRPRETNAREDASMLSVLQYCS